MAVAFAGSVVRVLAKSTATRWGVARAPKSTKSTHIPSQNAMKCLHFAKRKTAFLVMRIAKIDTDMLIVLDEDWGTYAFKACW